MCRWEGLASRGLPLLFASTSHSHKGLGKARSHLGLYPPLLETPGWEAENIQGLPSLLTKTGTVAEIGRWVRSSMNFLDLIKYGSLVSFKSAPPPHTHNKYIFYQGSKAFLK